MKIYETPEIKFIRFNDEEVVAASTKTPGVDTPEEQFSKDKDYISPTIDIGGFTSIL